MTWTSVSFFHPDVAVTLSHPCLGVEEGHENAPLRAQAGVVVVTLLHGIFVVLLTEPGVQDKATSHIRL